MVPHIPIELVRHIVDIVFVDHNDREVVQACCLVCTSWQDSCRSHLFHTVYIGSSSQIRHLHDLFRRSPVVADKVKYIQICPPPSGRNPGADYGSLHNTVPPLLFPLLRKLCSWSIDGGRGLTSRGFYFRANTLTCLKRFTGIKALSILNITFQTLSEHAKLILALPSLQDIIYGPNVQVVDLSVPINPRLQSDFSLRMSQQILSIHVKEDVLMEFTLSVLTAQTSQCSHPSRSTRLWRRAIQSNENPIALRRLALTHHSHNDLGAFSRLICANTVEVVHALDPSRYPAIDCHFFEELRSVCEQGIHDRVERLGLHFKFHSSAPTGHAGALLHVSPGKWKVVFCQPNISSLCAQIGKALLKNKTKLAISCPTLLADSRSTASIIRHAFAALFTEQCLELDLPEDPALRCPPRLPVHITEVSPDGQRSVSLGEDVLILKDCSSDVVLRTWYTFPRPGRHGKHHVISFSPDSAYFALANVWNLQIDIYHTEWDDLCGILQGPDSPVTCCTWSPDNSLFASGHESGQVLIWYMEFRGRDVRSNIRPAIALWERPIRALRFSDDGRLLAASEAIGDTTRCGLWDSTVKKWLHRDLRPAFSSPACGTVPRLAFARNNTVFTISEEVHRQIFRWIVNTGEEIPPVGYEEGFER